MIKERDNSGIEDLVREERWGSRPQMDVPIF